MGGPGSNIVRQSTCMSRFLLVSAALALLGTTSAFAQHRSFSIDSQPTGALVFVNGVESGATPYAYSYDHLPKEKESVNIELRSPGLVPRVMDIAPALRNMHSAKRQLIVELYREHPSDEQKVDLPMVTVLSVVKQTDDLGKVGPRRLDLKSVELRDLGYPDDLSGMVKQALGGTFIQSAVVRKGTERGNEAMRRAKVFLQPVITGVHMDLVSYDEAAFGTVELDMEWRFMSGIDPDSTLFTLTEHTLYNAFADMERDVLGNALRNAARRMIDGNGLRDRLVHVFSEGLIRSKGTQVEIVRPTPITFTGRKDMLASLVKGVVTVKTKDGFGSGFLIANDGYIVTNAHVVGEASLVSVRFNQGFTLDGQVVKVNRDFDLALIKTPANDLPALALGDDQGLLLGEELFAIGTPLDEQLGQTVTRGIMSGRREFEGRTFIQTDVSINPGNSGGPLIDESGKVVGIATLKVQESGVQGIGFAVPVSKMLEMLNILLVDH